jgi:hypothetical protein
MIFSSPCCSTVPTSAIPVTQSTLASRSARSCDSSLERPKNRKQMLSCDSRAYISRSRCASSGLIGHISTVVPSCRVTASLYASTQPCHPDTPTPVRPATRCLLPFPRPECVSDNTTPLQDHRNGNVPTGETSSPHCATRFCRSSYSDMSASAGHRAPPPCHRDNGFASEQHLPTRPLALAIYGEAPCFRPSGLLTCPSAL